MRELGQDNIEELHKIFITDEKYDKLKDWIKVNLLSKMDWRKNWQHFEIYNRLAFKNKVLEKLEATRRDISCSSLEEVIELLYTLGYSHKRIVFMVWEMGYDNINRSIVKKHIVKRRMELERKRREFMELIIKVKSEIFQDLFENIKETERKTAEIYLNKIKLLQDELEKLDPIAEPSKNGRIIRTIEFLQFKLNEMQGINDMRKATIEVNKEITIAREIHSIKNGHSPGGQPALADSGKALSID